ncbi:hypothetical protein HNV12_01615 [Methanococcoides sp. SA1]|nr:hypothetical protein [Methanococcoides sp. SA1]
MGNEYRRDLFEEKAGALERVADNTVSVARGCGVGLVAPIAAPTAYRVWKEALNGEGRFDDSDYSAQTPEERGVDSTEGVPYLLTSVGTAVASAYVVAGTVLELLEYNSDAGLAAGLALVASNVLFGAYEQNRSTRDEE